KTGQVLYALPIPHYFLPTPENPRQGIQQNRGFESLSLSSPNKDYLYTANESPLIQDLSDPSNASSGPIRILKFSLKNTDSPTEQRAYFPDQDAIFTSVPDLLCYYDSLLLVLERQILWPIEPRKRRIRIYSVDFSQPDATEIRNLDSLSGKKYTPLSKTLIFDSQLSNLLNVENFEGISWGPTWNNKPSLILVSDDNFSKSQKTEFLFLVPK
ncbi:MAG: esterase-like activity of phytase family protein, partial [Chthoniobacterales bacterium]|nr:esterase-like activity of phytase family protein [Chthoniobacterales bacterium]